MEALERVVAVIPNTTLRAGFLGFGSKAYTVVLTDRRMLFARITSAMMKQMVADARDEAKAAGQGFMGQWGAQLGAYGRFAEGYFELDPAAILAQTEGNFAVDNSSVVKAKLKAGYAGDSDTPSQPDRLIIKTTGRRYDLMINGGLGQAREALLAAGLI